ncbi:MAG: hypothetical protein M3N24_05670 [Actinomycetota bacterium]|nr:hypothetical protein [Actinomycetota bacterium]
MEEGPPLLEPSRPGAPPHALLPDFYSPDELEASPAHEEATLEPVDVDAANARLALALAAIIIVALLFIGLTNRREVRPQAKPAPRENLDLGAVTRRLALPSETSAALIPHAESVTFVASNRTTTEEAPTLLRLWRLIARTGEVLPGPVVAEIRELRLDPRPHADRLAYLLEGGGLFSLEGFYAARPTWINGQVADFDFASDGSLVYTPTEAEFTRRGGGAELRVELARTDPERHTSLASSFTSRIPLERVDGLEVRDRAVLVWGSLDGRGTVTVVDQSKRHSTRELPSVRVIDVGPDGELLAADDVGQEDPLPLVAQSPEAPFRRLESNSGFDLISVLGWSRKGSMIAAIGTSDGDSRQGLWAVPTGPAIQPTNRGERFVLKSPVWAGPATAGTGETFATFSEDGQLLFWTSGNAIRFLDVRTGRAFRISLPPHFRTAGPIAAA